METPIIEPVDFMKDFINEDVVSFKTKNGLEFSYKPTTGGDELMWIEQYLNGDGSTDRGKLNRCKMLNIRSVPYPKDFIKQILKIDEERPWAKLTEEEKWMFLNKLSPGMMAEIIIKINKIDQGDSEVKKN